MPVDQPHPAVLVEVGGVALPVGAALLGEQPAGVRVPEAAAARRRRRRRGRRAGCAGRPPRRCGRGACGGRRPRRSPGPGPPSSRGTAKTYSVGFVGLERAVGQQAVEADRDPDRGEQVHRRRAIARSVPLTTRFQSRTIAASVASEGNDHGAEVGDLLGSGHLRPCGKTRHDAVTQELVSKPTLLSYFLSLK